MKVKFEQMLYLFLAFLFTGAFMWFIKNSAVITMIAGIFVAVSGAFLGVDLLKMVKDTKAMPKGKFKPMNKWRYLVSLGLFGLLTGEAFTISQLYNRDITGVYGSIGVGFMIVLGLLVTGIEGNKVMTNEEVKETT